MPHLKTSQEIDEYIQAYCEKIYNDLYAIFSKERFVWRDKHFHHDFDDYSFNISWWQFIDAPRQPTIIKWWFELGSPQTIFDMIKLPRDLGYNEVKLIAYIPDPKKNIEEENEYYIKKNPI
jgi:hypothetical protein